MEIPEVFVTCSRCHRIGGSGETVREAHDDARARGWPLRRYPNPDKHEQGQPGMLEELDVMCRECKEKWG